MSRFKELVKRFDNVQANFEHRIQKLEHPPKYAPGTALDESLIICGEPVYRDERYWPVPFYAWKYQICNKQTGALMELWEGDIDKLLSDKKSYEKDNLHP